MSQIQKPPIPVPVVTKERKSKFHHPKGAPDADQIFNSYGNRKWWTRRNTDVQCQQQQQQEEQSRTSEWPLDNCQATVLYGVVEFAYSHFEEKNRCGFSEGGFGLYIGSYSADVMVNQLKPCIGQWPTAAFRSDPAVSHSLLQFILLPKQFRQRQLEVLVSLACIVLIDFKVRVNKTEITTLLFIVKTEKLVLHIFYGNGENPL